MSKSSTALVQNVTALIESTIEACSTSTKRSEITAALTALRESVSGSITHLTNEEKRKFISVRKGLKAIYNIVDGSIEGLSSGDMTRKEFKATLNTLRTRFYPDVCASLSKEIDMERERAAARDVELNENQLAVKEALAGSPSLNEAKIALQKAKVGQIGGAVNKSDEEIKKALESMDAYRNNLPITLKTGYQVVRMPILPIFSNYNMNSTATYDKLGIKYIPIEGYAVLLEQSLIAVSASRAAKANLTPLEYVQSVVSLMNEGSSNCELVTDQPHINPRNKDILLFWVLPKTKMSVLMKIALTGSKASTLKWDFPFSS